MAAYQRRSKLMQTTGSVRSLKPRTRQYTIRGITQRINDVLKKKAKEENKSLNEVVLECIEKGLGLAEEKIYYNDLDDLAGTWKHDPEFDTMIAEMDKIDPEIWK